MTQARFSASKNLNKTNIGEVSAETAGVYKLYNRSGNVLYAGIAKRGMLQEQLMEHMKGGTAPIPGAKSFKFKPVGNLKDSRKELTRIIKREKPKLNQKAA